MSTPDLQVQAKALGDPTRHRIFRYLADASEPLGVAEITEHLGLNHNAIRQHLAQLVEAGLVVESVAAPGARGRPRLNYTLHPNADSKWGVQGPYERLALWLAEMVRTGDSPFEVGRRAGLGGRSSETVAVDPARAVFDRMALDGFEPTTRRRGDAIEITLTTCPFESTALADPGTVCELHRGIAAGVAESVGGIVVDELIRKDPRRANCRLRCHLDDDLPAGDER
ncbi:MAG TPA: helix-turn-helix domain-containing protein [Microthrixaceae bacterium]|nr:helix-turn-helix domain-containing protein [Microthrixaceae bacterium]